MALSAPKMIAEPSCEQQVGDHGPARTDEWMRTLYRENARPLYRFLLRMTGERQAAEDLLQETLLRAWRNRDNLPADFRVLRRWMFTVARRVAIDAFRARDARPMEVGAIDVSGLPSTHDAIEQLLTVQTVRRALGSLTPEHRAVLVELYFRGRMAAEVATLLGIPEGTVKSRAYYAVRQMREVTGLGK
ncbi:sigma-70 family RNA polymerase sigma factor [Dactylosporangium sp. NPDC005572]|uniref:sigma-70 family RNA polymerase sigma factor n=1 Tax=Dactylosporangium sp. NPDC005572 TaxID=3156889 RepID=UPI0033AF6CA4